MTPCLYKTLLLDPEFPYHNRKSVQYTAKNYPLYQETSNVKTSNVDHVNVSNFFITVPPLYFSV